MKPVWTLLLVGALGCTACSIDDQQITTTTVKTTNSTTASTFTLSWDLVEGDQDLPDYQLEFEDQILDTGESKQFNVETEFGADIAVQLRVTTMAVNRTFTFDPIALVNDPYGLLELTYTQTPAGEYTCEDSYK